MISSSLNGDDDVTHYNDDDDDEAPDWTDGDDVMSRLVSDQIESENMSLKILWKYIRENTLEKMSLKILRKYIRENTPKIYPWKYSRKYVCENTSEKMSLKILQIYVRENSPDHPFYILRLNLERLNQGWTNLQRELKLQKHFSTIWTCD